MQGIGSALVLQLTKGEERAAVALRNVVGPLPLLKPEAAEAADAPSWVPWTGDWDEPAADPGQPG